MEIQFVWIEEYRNIFNQGFNFSNRYKFSYNQSDGVIGRKQNENFIEDFFGSNITSVVGIIGENGSGKSNVLDFIKECISNYDNGHFVIWQEISTKFIIVIDKYIIHHKSLTVKNIEELSRLGYRIEKYEDCINDFDTTIMEFYENGYVFYSNIYDAREEIDFSTLINISTNYLITHEKYSDERFLESWTPLGTENYVDSLFAFRIKDIKRQIDFITNSKEYIFPFRIPHEISISVDPLEQNRFLRIDNEVAKKYNLEFFPEIEFTIKSQLRDQKEKIDGFIIFKQIFTSYLFRLIASEYPEDVNQIGIKIISAYIFGRESEIESISEKGQKILTDINECLAKLNQLKGYISVYINTNERSFRDYSTIRVALNQESSELFFDFVLSYNKIAKTKEFLDFYWTGLSSGEKSMLSLFARFHHIKDLDFIKERKHIVVLVDEGETYYHPHWQKMFFNELLKYLITIFFDKSIQIILTSNSPFIASDLPKENVIFLRKSQDNNCIVDDLGLKKQKTFGANIHILYTDSFFLKNGLIGEFAKEKINQTIDWLIDLENFENIEIHKKIIELIDEDLIAVKLKQMFNRKLEGLTEITISPFDLY